MREKANWALLVSIILGGGLPKENVSRLSASQNGQDTIASQFLVDGD